MEKIKNWVMSLGKKKIIILAIGIGMLAVIAILSIVIQPAPTAPGIPTPTPSSLIQQNGTISGNMQPTIAVVTVASQNSIPKWKNYEGSNYTIAVPPDWSAYPRQTLSGGEVVIIKPDIIPDEINYPEFIFYKNSNASKIQQKIRALKALGFTESTITVLGKLASKLSGTLSFKTVGGQRVNQPIQVTNVFLTQGDMLYTFSYQYEGSTPSKLLEEYFTDIINGIHLK